jgi:hypothetical protein
MRPLLNKAALLLTATLATSALATTADAHYQPNSCGWSTASGDTPVFNGPTPDGPYYTGPYRGAFARLADPDETRCLMECRVRPTRWGPQYYDVRVCRGAYASARPPARRAVIRLK